MGFFTENSLMELNSAEKLVLFEFLSRFFETSDLAIIDQAEEAVLLKVRGNLEKELVEPFKDNYTELLKKARDDVRGGPRYPCPCCGNYTLEAKERGSFEICPVCFWEDDNIQFDDPNYRGGANLPSLNEARESYKVNGYAKEKSAQNVRKPYFFELPAHQNRK